MATKAQIHGAMQRLKISVKSDGLRTTAKSLGLSPGYVSEILGGTRKLGKKAQKALGCGA